MPFRPSLCFATALVLLDLGCSDDSATAPPPVTPPAADAAPPAPTGTLDVLVVDTDLYSTANPYPPLASVSVAVYPPGGGAVMEMTTGANGRATFTGIDWSLGKATIVGYAADRNGSILTNFSPDSLAVLDKAPNFDGLYFGLATKASVHPKTTLTGTIANKADASHYVTIGSTVGLAQFQNTTATYSLAVPQGGTVSLVATEWRPETTPEVATFLKWIKVDVPTNSTNLDIDFSTAAALTSTHVKRTFEITGGPSGSLGGTTGYEIVTLTSTQAPLGFLTSRQPAADGSSVAIEDDAISDFPGQIVSYHILSKSDGSASYVIDDGVPADGAMVTGFVAPPAFSFDSVRLGDPLPLTGLVGDENCTVTYVDSSGDELFEVYRVRDDLDATSFTITSPRRDELPMAMQTQIGTKPLTAQLVCTRKDDLLPISALPKHYILSRPFNSSL